jgi:hypothetical protein
MVGASIGIESVEQVAPDTWMVIGKKGASAWSWGELVRAVIQSAVLPDATRGVTVRIITQRRLATNVTARGDWSQQIFTQLDLLLAGGSADSASVRH